jgi:hypothetical protein
MHETLTRTSPDVRGCLRSRRHGESRIVLKSQLSTHKVSHIYMHVKGSPVEIKTA